MEESVLLEQKKKYFKKHKKRFPEKERKNVEEKLMGFSEQQFLALQATDIISINKIGWISFLVGEFGIDRFIIGDKKKGILKLLLCWTLLPWWIDFVFFIDRDTRRVNLKRFNKIAEGINS